MPKPSEIERLRINLGHAIGVIKTVAADLEKLERREQPRVDPEDHLDTIQQAQRLWGPQPLPERSQR